MQILLQKEDSCRKFLVQILIERFYSLLDIFDIPAIAFLLSVSRFTLSTLTLNNLG
jgi:hypothetical protein